MHLRTERVSVRRAQFRRGSADDRAMNALAQTKPVTPERRSSEWERSVPV
ncbi:MAG: hypothetical protein H0T72_14500 [Chloroflexia bacterium]|nr:hypothetical protein [Chloroflexia bacterium]